MLDRYHLIRHPHTHLIIIVLFFCGTRVRSAIRTLSNHFFSDSDPPVASRMAVNLGLSLSLWNPNAATLFDPRRYAKPTPRSFPNSKTKAPIKPSPRAVRREFPPARPNGANPRSRQAAGGRAGHQTEGNPHPNATRRRVRE